LDADEFHQFSDALASLIESDNQIVLFEFVLQKIIRRQVEPHFTDDDPPTTEFYTIRPLVRDCAVLLSALANTGQTDSADITKAFQAGAPYLRASDASLVLLPPDQCGLNDISESLDRLVLAAPQIKKNVLEACTQVVGADGLIHENEAELLRGIAETLDCPMPPFVTSS